MSPKTDVRWQRFREERKKARKALARLAIQRHERLPLSVSNVKFSIRYGPRPGFFKLVNSLLFGGGGGGGRNDEKHSVVLCRDDPGSNYIAVYVGKLFLYIHTNGHINVSGGVDMESDVKYLCDIAGVSYEELMGLASQDNVSANGFYPCLGKGERLDLEMVRKAAENVEEEEKHPEFCIDYGLVMSTKLHMESFPNLLIRTWLGSLMVYSTHSVCCVGAKCVDDVNLLGEWIEQVLLPRVSRMNSSSRNK